MRLGRLAAGTIPSARLIEDNIGYLAAVRTTLVEALSALANAADLDGTQIAEQWLGTSQP